eukprot:scaffold10570_cov290-Chaetoceros_neogracile.AAC.29
MEFLSLVIIHIESDGEKMDTREAHLTGSKVQDGLVDKSSKSFDCNCYAHSRLPSLLHQCIVHMIMHTLILPQE